MSFPNKKPRVDTSRAGDAAPALHNVPDNFVPLVPPPHDPSEFFSDFDPDADPRRNQQIRAILNLFPPPVPPETSDDADQVKIPFIWPPPPVIQPQQLPYSMAAFRHNLERFCRLLKIGGNDKRRRRPADDSPASEYVLAPPLPFPPANFMPYPLRAPESLLTPTEVFDMLLDAKDHLPRVDMILALAAGQLVDYHNQVGEEGLDQDYYDVMLAKKGHGLRLRGRGRRGGFGGDDDDDFEGIDTRDYSDDSDAIYTTIPPRDWQYTQAYQQVTPLASYERFSRKQGQFTEKLAPAVVDELSLGVDELPHHSRLSQASDDGDDDVVTDIAISDVTNQEPGDITLANGMHRQRRRQLLFLALDTIEDHHHQYTDDMFRRRKQQLLERLDNLRRLQIHCDNSLILDDELAAYDRRQRLVRDHELVRIWLERNYELLKALLTFYTDLNRIYRDYLQLMTNKLGKLQHFFQYQQQVLAQADPFDIKSRDLVKLYQGQLTTDYAAQIKQIVKSQVALTLTNTPEADDIDRGALVTPPPAKAGVSLTQLNETDTALVHDYMPLITPAEFNMITGDVARQQKAKGSSPNKQNPSLKHHIFQLPLYDPVTLGSDTNASDLALTPMVGVPRRGRRTATPTAAQGGPRAADGVLTQHTEATLLAKIMKHFVGPLQATNDEYNADLDQMAIDSKWLRK